MDWEFWVQKDPWDGTSLVGWDSSEGDCMPSVPRVGDTVNVIGKNYQVFKIEYEYGGKEIPPGNPTKCIVRVWVK